MKKLNEQQFLNDVARHEMIVIHDERLNRHIRFKRPGSNCMHFDLITWPGYLCYSGDMGTYVFWRLEDMFSFFRTDREHSRDGQTLAINPGYWGEKLEAVDRHDGFKEFSEERFKAAVIGDLINWLRGHRDETTKEERRDLWDAVMSEVIDADSDSSGYRQQYAAHEFSHHVNVRVGSFHFQDFWGHTLTEYSHRFLWCCFALAWGIQQYDAAKSEAPHGA